MVYSVKEKFISKVQNLTCIQIKRLAYYSTMNLYIGAQLTPSRPSVSGRQGSAAFDPVIVVIKRNNLDSEN